MYVIVYIARDAVRTQGGKAAISCSVMVEETPATFHSTDMQMRLCGGGGGGFKVISDHIHWKTSVKKQK